MRHSLEIELEPVDHDPLPTPAGMRPWEPWPPNLAAALFLAKLTGLQDAAERDAMIRETKAAFSRHRGGLTAHRACTPAGRPLPDTWVNVEAGDGSCGYEGVVIDGARDEDGTWGLDGDFVIFTTTHAAGGERIRVRGWCCHVELL
jgi:hypothetical protein